ncbi:radical SAM protein [bacterium]|nr:radical SAM protein [bacterium]
MEGIIHRLSGLYAFDHLNCRSLKQGPSKVQLQTIDRCNGSCLMCPYSSELKSGPPNYMEDSLYKKIIKSLQDAGTLRQIVLMLQNEPLLDIKLIQRIHYAREVLGKKVKIGIVTNGTLLNPRHIHDLVYSGINSIDISIDAFSEKTYNIIRPGLDFFKVVQNTQAILENKKRVNIVVRFLKQRANTGEEKQFRHYWESKGAKVFIFAPVNRAGGLKNFDQIKNNAHRSNIFYLKKKLKKAIRNLCLQVAARSFIATPCLLPFNNINILWNGKVILCCHDWEPVDIIGDLSKQSLQDVWNSDSMNKYRYLLWSNRIKESPVCKNCSLAMDKT